MISYDIDHLIQQNEDVMLRFVETSIKNIEKSYNMDKCEILSHLEYRREDACRSFVLLYKNGQFYDAIIISGYILELSSLIHTIKSDDKGTNYDKYLLMYCISEMTSLLVYCDLPKAEITKEMQNNYYHLLLVLEKAGDRLIQKDIKLNDVISQLKDKNIKDSKKALILRESFKTPSINTQVSNYIKFLQLKMKQSGYSDLAEDKNLFHLGYQAYCSIKHGNLQSIAITNDYYRNTSLFLIYNIKFFENN